MNKFKLLKFGICGIGAVVCASLSRELFLPLGFVIGYYLPDAIVVVVNKFFATAPNE